MFHEKKDSDVSGQSVGFISSWSWMKLANSGILEWGENCAAMGVASVERGCAHCGGRLVQLACQLTRVAPCKAGFLAMAQAEIIHTQATSGC